MQPTGEPNDNAKTAKKPNEDHTILVCTAPHPRAGSAEGRFTGRLHGVRLQSVPFVARATYRHVSSWADARPGCLVVRCSSPDCRAFSEYQILGPVHGVRGTLVPSHPAQERPARRLVSRKRPEGREERV